MRAGGRDGSSRLGAGLHGALRHGLSGGPDDIELVNVVVQDNSHQPASIETARSYAEFMEITDWTVLADPTYEWIQVWGDPDDSKPQQTYTVINTAGRVVYHGAHASGTTVTAIISNVESADD
ncbi:MAG: hypothetical protein GY913_35755 [Proteobacteria bacterium]|nr:hypothetical protein [Pseudomonadota bacterium]MCP4922288.1 hypothetical protein [Pseudomonadota bacterium]